MTGSCFLCLRKTGQLLKLCRSTNYAYNRDYLILNNSIPFDFIGTNELFVWIYCLCSKCQAVLYSILHEVWRCKF